MLQTMSGASLFFQGGTLVLAGAGEHDLVPTPPFRWIRGRWRCEAYHYTTVAGWLREQRIADRVPRWQPLNYPFQDIRQPHVYQEEAIEAWRQAGGRGSIVLPTGSGKSYVALSIIHKVNRSAVVVAPTIDLMMQWYALLSATFGAEIGVFYGREKDPRPLTVTTYSSLGTLMELAARGEKVGNKDSNFHQGGGNFYKLIIFDEAHHLPAPAWSEGALMSPSPFRLGLTATYPTEAEQSDGRGRLDELIGPIVYSLKVDDLVGEQLANYRTQRIRVSLTDTERAAYDRDRTCYGRYVQRHGLLKSHGAGWLQELQRLSAKDREARAALLARQRVVRLIGRCEGKMQALDALLRLHTSDQVLVFTEHNDVAYDISRRYLIPCISHESGAAERKEILEAFRERRYKVILSTQALNEGVDTPSAKVAIIIGGTAGAREFTQRLGRVLRKVENREAVLYEVIVRGTIDESKAQRRRANLQAEEVPGAHQ